MKFKNNGLGINRRLFLTGAGAAIALPFLRSALPKRVWADAATIPVRMLAYYYPNGMYMQDWTPNNEGRDYDFKNALAPLQPHKEDMLVLSGLNHRNARPNPGPGDHGAGTGAFLTCVQVRKTEGSDIRNGISMDQVAANAIGGATARASIQVGAARPQSFDQGYSGVYTNNISWRNETQPLPKITSPRALFDTLFAGFEPGTSAGEATRRQAIRASVLDSVLDQADGLRSRMGTADQNKLDEYLTSVREVERRIERVEEMPICAIPDRPNVEGGVEGIRILHELMALAFQCDITRVQSFMLDNSGSQERYDFLGASDHHHRSSHQMLATHTDGYRKICRWESEMFADFLTRLKTKEAADGTPLLDHCAVFFSSEMSDGGSHSHDNMPVVLAGKGGGAFNTGRHLRYGGTPIANLYVSMLQAVCVDTTRFGDSTGPLDRLA